MEYGASAVFHAAGTNPHSERPGPRSDGRSVFLPGFFAISQIENANRRFNAVRVRGPAGSDPRGAYAASKTADTPYSKLEAVLQVGGGTPSWRRYSKLEAVLQVGGGAPVGWRAFGLIAPRGLVVELRR